METCQACGGAVKLSLETAERPLDWECTNRDGDVSKQDPFVRRWSVECRLVGYWGAALPGTHDEVLRVIHNAPVAASVSSTTIVSGWRAGQWSARPNPVGGTGCAVKGNSIRRSRRNVRLGVERMHAIKVDTRQAIARQQ